MICPNGHDARQLVNETRPGLGVVYRRRYCCQCGARYVTKEAIHDGPIPIAAAQPKRKSQHDHLFTDKKNPFDIVKKST